MRLVVLLMLIFCETFAGLAQNQFFTGTVTSTSFPNSSASPPDSPIFALPVGASVSGSFEVNTANLDFSNPQLNWYTGGADAGGLFIASGPNSLSFGDTTLVALYHTQQSVYWNAYEHLSATLRITCGPNVNANQFPDVSLSAFPLYIPAPLPGSDYCTATIELADGVQGAVYYMGVTIGTLQNTSPDPAPVLPPKPPHPIIPRPVPIGPPPLPPKPPTVALIASIEIDNEVVSSSNGVNQPQTYVAGELHRYKGFCSPADAQGMWTIPTVTGQPAPTDGAHDQDVLIGGWSDTDIGASKVRGAKLPVVPTDPNAVTPEDAYLWYPGPVNGLSFTCSSNGLNASATAPITVLSPTATVIAHVGEPDLYHLGQTLTSSGTLHLGPVPIESNLESAGVELDACKPNTPNGYRSSYEDFFWVQTVNISYTLDKAKTTNTKMYGGLDAGPKPGKVSYVAGFTLLDNPGADLGALQASEKDVRTVSLQQQFASTLMWKSPHLPSIPVPVSTINWGFDAAANYVGVGYWSTLGLVPENQSYPPEGTRGQAAVAYPSWNNARFAKDTIARQTPTETPRCQ